MITWGGTEEHIAQGGGVETPGQLARGITAGGEDTREDQPHAVPGAGQTDVFLGQAHDGHHYGAHSQTDEDGQQGSQQLLYTVLLQ